MFDIFKSMIKEEWRMHSNLFGSGGFALFPVFIFLFTFFVSLVLPVFREYNGTNFALYAVSVMPLLMVNIILSMFGPYYVLADLLLVPLAFYMLGKSFKKWDLVQSQLF